MNDELEALLRDHYRRAADGIVPDAAVIRRAQAAPQEGRTTWRRRWGVPALAAALTAVAVTVAALLWPQPSGPARPAERPPSIELTPPPGRSPSPSPSRPTVEPTPGSTPGQPTGSPSRRPVPPPTATEEPTPGSPPPTGEP